MGRSLLTGIIVSVKLDSMKTEQSEELRRRAATYAALGDPLRLQIVDSLAVGDASSSELGAALDVPSNLLAHHLRILEEAGLVRRNRSEGDRRRSYWRLDHDALLDLGPRQVAAPDRVLFVCTANSARSHLAAALWRCCSSIPAASAGTHPAARIDPRAVEVAERHQVALVEAVPRHLEEVAADGDLVVTVCDRAHEELGAASDLHWSVPDPVVAGTRAAFDAALDELATRVQTLVPRLADPAAR